ncbi:hypothetical protein ACFOY5_09880 [Massilia aurea]|jgi:hypothetical protein|uniref:hypothetical protein n=1 Tax=Massilia aurea TaxID=373040 RepID=UPI0021635A57|nr:hypothetical protein [Massilia aurea]MCS0709624.1 hypothetical protein [Massilia aurea]
MNVLKHMEAVFIAAALIAVPVGYLAKVSDANANSLIALNASSAAIASGAKVATVTVTAKRLSNAEKSQLLALDTVTAASRL